MHIIDLLKIINMNKKQYLLALEDFILPTVNNKSWPFPSETISFKFNDFPGTRIYHYTADELKHFNITSGHIMYNTHKPLPNQFNYGRALSYQKFPNFDNAPRFHTVSSILESKTTLVGKGPDMAIIPELMGIWSKGFDSQTYKFSMDEYLILQPVDLLMIPGPEAYIHLTNQLIQILSAYSYTSDEINQLKSLNDILLGLISFIAKDANLTPEEIFISCEHLITQIPNLKPPYSEVITEILTLRR